MKGSFPILSSRWIGLALLVTTLLSMPVDHGLAQDTVVTIDPRSGAVNVGDTTKVKIRVENVTGLYSAEVQLTFNPALLEVVDADPDTPDVQIQPGKFLNPDEVTQNVVDLSAGRISFAIAQRAPDEPVDGSGVLAKIEFRGKVAGTSNIDFAAVLLRDRDGGAISASTQGGVITVATPTPPAGILGHHTVQPRETLYCIARAYGVDPYAIARENGILNPNVIHPGHDLKIPDAPYTLPPGRVCPRQFDGDTPTPPTCRERHPVVRGENLYRISLRYDVSMWAIAEANYITNLNYIRAGQVLCIP